MSNKGWKHSPENRKDHYFDGGLSLCGKHRIRFGCLWVNSRKRCKSCDKKLAELRAKRMQSQE